MLVGLRLAILCDDWIQPPLPVMWPLPTAEGPWGILSPLQGSKWGDQIPAISGEIWSLALHGRTQPLRQLLGPPPPVRARRLPLVERECIEYGCVLRGSHCTPGSGKLPRCYRSPEPDLHRLVYAVAMAWDEGRYVVVVTGNEFVV